MSQYPFWCTGYSNRYYDTGDRIFAVILASRVTTTEDSIESWSATAMANRICNADTDASCYVIAMFRGISNDNSYSNSIVNRIEGLLLCSKLPFAYRRNFHGPTGCHPDMLFAMQWHCRRVTSWIDRLKRTRKKQRQEH